MSSNALSTRPARTPAPAPAPAPAPYFRLTLTPLQVPETPSRTDRETESGRWTRRVRVAQSRLQTEHPEIVPRLLVCPGKPSQLLARVQNSHSQAWQFRLVVSSSIPREWRGALNEWVDIAAKENNTDDEGIRESEIHFEIPADYFENQRAITSEKQSLKIDYDGHVQVYARPSGTTDEPGQLMATAPFKIKVRSPSRYLDYLPQVYREVDFIGRLLNIFEASFDPSVETLKLLWAYLDPRTSPENLLPFLAHWVGWPTDFHTEFSPENASPLQLKRQRQLIFNAMTLHRWRGTSQGLRHYLHLYTGLPESETHIHIENAFKPGFKLGNAQIGETAIIGGGRPYHFVVKLRSHPPNVSYEELLAQTEIIRTIIRQEKPAFCTYELHILPENDAELVP